MLVSGLGKKGMALLVDIKSLALAEKVFSFLPQAIELMTTCSIVLLAITGQELCNQLTEYIRML